MNQAHANCENVHMAWKKNRTDFQLGNENNQKSNILKIEEAFPLDDNKFCKLDAFGLGIKSVD